MKSVFTDKVNTELPLNDYPRPQMVRDNWLNLNGLWHYSINNNAEDHGKFDGEILVPFSPECELSGVNRVLMPKQYLWYQRHFLLTDEYDGKRALLHFGAVDCEAKVYLNGTEIGSHIGGYLPFEMDVTDFVNPGENEIVVRVRDDTDTSFHARGKQSMHRGGIWYSPQSGIWQTVWMEAVPHEYIRSLRITPDFDSSSVMIEAEAEEAVAVFDGKKYNLPAVIHVENCEAWTPETPKLYDFSVVSGEDKVDSYFAVRKMSVEEDDEGIKRIFLNGKPYFNNGLLDQGYWSDGMYTAPTDEAMSYDIELAKKMGFNVLRKHIKIEPLRWYYHCDRLGMIVWQDMINGGKKYNWLLISAPLVTNLHLKDSSYSLFARKDLEGRKEYLSDLSGMIKHLYNCPSICLWVPFNEGWGQFDAKLAYKTVLENDNTRVVDSVSGWHDQKTGDFRSWHVYFRKYRFRKDSSGRAVVLSEFGGFSLKIDGHTFNNKYFGYKKFKNSEQFETALKNLYLNEIMPAKKQGLAAAIYTELSDVEDELNGFVTYDRAVVKLDPDTVRSIVSI